MTKPELRFGMPITPIALKEERPSVAFAHLGCEKNRVDTEHMLGLLAEAGYGVSNSAEDATVVVV
ncbi:MAG: 30S ribosomal protein S12 methylthiotransferase RimO, partial [Prochlorococcaceae cyanobacterium ETNP2_MAG_10]|nr:30S ribosomal protein S12 methylthiotransferase RimO [Prochlorococcaceae cyanobacterium ETNP2_MAG_10]